MLASGDALRAGRGAVPERSAIVVTTPTAASTQTNGASVRVHEVVTLLEQTGYRVVRTALPDLDRAAGTFDLGVAVSYTCATALTPLRARCTRVWLDAVDSWLLVNLSGLRRGHATYVLRALRDATRMARMPEADVLTYISAADLVSDRGTVRGHRRLVLPGAGDPPAVTPRSGRRVVLAGDWDYPPNRDGLRWFGVKVLPVMEELSPSHAWTVAVYGTGLTDLPASPRVRGLGYAQDPSELYSEGDVHAAPVRFGGGVKRKVLQPLLAGLPVVATASAAHGLRPHPLLDVRSGSEAFAQALVDRLERRHQPLPVPLADLVDRDDRAALCSWLMS